MKTPISIRQISVARMVCREIPDRELGNFLAQLSGLVGTGVGFQAAHPPDPVLSKILSGRAVVASSRGGYRREQQTYTARATAVPSGIPVPVAFAPASGRGEIGRLTCQHAGALVIPRHQGRVVLVLAQSADEQVHIGFATESEVAVGLWPDQHNNLLHAVLHTARPSNIPGQGHLDVTSGRYHVG